MPLGDQVNYLQIHPEATPEYLSDFARSIPTVMATMTQPPSMALP